VPSGIDSRHSSIMPVFAAAGPVEVWESKGYMSSGWGEDLCSARMVACAGLRRHCRRVRRRGRNKFPMPPINSPQLGYFKWKRKTKRSWMQLLSTLQEPKLAPPQIEAHMRIACYVKCKCKRLVVQNCAIQLSVGSMVSKLLRNCLPNKHAAAVSDEAGIKDR